MKSFKYGLVLLACVIATACTSVKVITDYDPGKNFSTMNSYAWLDTSGRPVEDLRVDNDLMHARITRAVDNEFHLRGFQEVAANEASFLITYHIASETKLDIDSYYTNFGYYNCWNCYGPGGGYGGLGYNNISVRQYQQGIFMLDIIDPATKKLMWRGVAEKRLNRGSPEERDAYVNEIIQAIIDKFPPERIQQ